MVNVGTMDVVPSVVTESIRTESKDANHGGVDKISELPLDILREIFSLLHPTAVLRLAQTCKAFRKYLMNPTLARLSVWVPALKAVERLPPCPEGVSEPRYTYYIFYARCDDCLSREADKIIHFYSTHEMFCVECIPKHFAALGDIPGASDKHISALISTWTVPTVQLSNGMFRRSPGFHIASVKKLIEEYQAINPDDGDAVDTLRERWETSTSERKRHDQECTSFIDYEGKIYGRVKAERQKEVVEHLSALGYSEECRTFILKDVDAVPQQRRAMRVSFGKTLDRYIQDQEYRRLTEHEWLQLQGEILPFMEEERKYRLEERRAALMVNRINKWFKPEFLEFVYSQPPNTVLTTAAELAFMPEWREALLSKAVEEDLSAEDIKSAVALMPASCEKIRRWKTQQLVDIVRRSRTYEGQNVTEHTLSFASTIFRCSDCKQCFTCTTALVHRCNYVSEFNSEAEVVFEGMSQSTQDPDSRELTRRNPNEREALITKAFSRYGNHQSDRWNALQTSTFDDAAHSHMVKLLDTIGRELTTLAIEMEKEQPYVEVLCSCYKKSEEDRAQRRAMNWLDAINHCSHHSVEEKSDQWYARLHDQDLEVVAERRQKELRDAEEDGYFPNIWAIQKGHDLGRDYFFEELGWEKMRHPDGKKATRAYVDSMAPYILPGRYMASCVVALQAFPGESRESESNSMDVPTSHNPLKSANEV